MEYDLQYSTYCMEKGTIRSDDLARVLNDMARVKTLRLELSKIFCNSLKRTNKSSFDVYCNIDDDRAAANHSLSFSSYRHVHWLDLPVAAIIDRESALFSSYSVYYLVKQHQ